LVLIFRAPDIGTGAQPIRFGRRLDRFVALEPSDRLLRSNAASDLNARGKPQEGIMTLSRVLLLIALLAMGSIQNAALASPEIPPGAMPLTNEEIEAALGGKTFRFIVYDRSKSLTGTSTWDLGRGAVYGDYVWDNQDPKQWKRKWFIENNQNCTQPRNKDPECQNIYLDGENFIEVTDDGTIHAVSTPID